MRLIIAGLLLFCLLSSCAVNQWQPGQYTVSKGDTLYAIAWRYRVDYKQLAHWNNISAPYKIYAGQKIWISKPRYTLVSTTSKPQVSSKPARSTKPVNFNKPVYTSQAKETTIAWRWPVKKPYTITKKFKGASSTAQGIDLQANLGTPVYAAANGHVVYSGNGLIGYGNLVIVKHSDTFLSAYALNQKLFVKEGQKVVIGQKIAAMGLNVDKKPALHFEIRRYGKPVNPIKYLP